MCLAMVLNNLGVINWLYPIQKLSTFLFSFFCRAVCIDGKTFIIQSTERYLIDPYTLFSCCEMFVFFPPSFHRLGFANWSLRNDVHNCFHILGTIFFSLVLRLASDYSDLRFYVSINRNLFVFLFSSVHQNEILFSACDNRQSVQWKNYVKQNVYSVSFLGFGYCLAVNFFWCRTFFQSATKGDILRLRLCHRLLFQTDVRDDRYFQRNAFSNLRSCQNTKHSVFRFIVSNSWKFVKEFQFDRGQISLRFVAQV